MTEEIVRALREINKTLEDISASLSVSLEDIHHDIQFFTKCVYKDEDGIYNLYVKQDQ